MSPADPSRDREAITRYQAGQSLSQIARDLDCCLETVRKALKRHGVARRPRGNSYRQFTAEQVEDVARRWMAGEAQTSIAKSYGAHQITISRVLAKAGHVKESRIRSGSDHPNWKGGRPKQSGGYSMIWLAPDSPFTAMRNTSGYVLEHRLIAAQKLGRPLLRSETVHHINGVKTDNRPENLQVRAGRHGNGQAMQCGDCGSHNVIYIPLSD